MISVPFLFCRNKKIRLAKRERKECLEMSEKVNAPEISVKNVSMVFSDSKGNPVQALKNVSIDIQKG